ncbi:TetR/AcrR family transcriptional regulator [Streptomyces sp. M10(2022)]
MSPAGRPRTFDLEAVLEAAMLLFWEQGYEATSLTQLREATGLSSASLYGAFGSKEGLFEKAVEHYIAGPGSVTDVVADEAASPGRPLPGCCTGRSTCRPTRPTLVDVSSPSRGRCGRRGGEGCTRS